MIIFLSLNNYLFLQCLFLLVQLFNLIYFHNKLIYDLSVKWIKTTFNIFTYLKIIMNIVLHYYIILIPYYIIGNKNVTIKIIT